MKHPILTCATLLLAKGVLLFSFFDRSVAGTKVAELARAFGISEQAVHKVRQRIRDRMEELIAEQVREEDSIDERAS